jgi:hypothetical protein
MRRESHGLGMGGWEGYSPDPPAFAQAPVKPFKSFEQWVVGCVVREVNLCGFETVQLKRKPRGK